jgi:MFS family permease
VAQERRALDPLLPARLFRSGEFVRGVALAFLVALGMFAATFLLPLYFQLVRGADASQSGVLVVPFLGANVVASYFAGAMARRLGRTRGILLAGVGACAIGFALLGVASSTTSDLLAVGSSMLLGAGVGGVMPVVTVVVQNAIERRDIGTGTGALLFLRSMGGAFGSTLAGVLLTGRFNAALADTGRRIDLGALRAGSDALAALGSLRARAVEALVSGFHLAFWVCCGLLLAAIAITASMRDLPLSGRR